MKMEGLTPHPKFSHLEKGFSPIIVCLSTVKDIEALEMYPFHNMSKSGKEEIDEIQDIAYYESPEYYKEKNIFNAGIATYAISEVNPYSKYSLAMYDCTGIVVVGEDKNTNKNISFISHQDPKKFLDPIFTRHFKEGLSDRLQTLFSESKKGSIDALIVGGNLKYIDNYTESITLLNELIRRELQFEPTVVTGPKETAGGTNIFFDTKNRRLYISGPRQPKNISNHDFKAGQVEQQLEKIDNEPKD